MLRFLQFLKWGGADTLGRGIGRDEVGVGSFEVAQLTKQPVMLLVRDLRASCHIVEVVVPVEFSAQRHNALFRFCTRRVKGLVAHGNTTYA